MPIWTFILTVGKVNYVTTCKGFCAELVYFQYWCCLGSCDLTSLLSSLYLKISIPNIQCRRSNTNPNPAKKYTWRHEILNNNWHTALPSKTFKNQNRSRTFLQKENYLSVLPCATTQLYLILSLLHLMD